MESNFDQHEQSPPEPPPGYVSEEAKSGYVKRVVLAVVIAAAIQLLVPMIGSALTMINAMDAMANRKTIDPEKGAFWKGALWLVSGEAGPKGTAKSTLIGWTPKEGSEPKEASLPPVEVIGLLSDEKSLWALGGDAVVEMSAKGLDPVMAKDGLESPSRPFFWEGVPAVVDQRTTDEGDTVMELKLWNGKTWKVLEEAAPNLAAETYIHMPSMVFLNGPEGVFPIVLEADGIRARDSLDGFALKPTEEWELKMEVPERTYIWTADHIDGHLALFAVESKDFDQRIVGKIERDGVMEPLVDFDVGLVADISVYPTGVKEEYIIVTLGPSGGVKAYHMRGSQLLYESFVTDAAMPTPGESMNSSLISSFVGVLPSLLVAFLITGWMRERKVSTVETDFGTVRLASLGERGIALLVDGGIVFVPMLVAWFAWAGWDALNVEEQGIEGMMRVVAVMGVGAAWLLVCMFVFSFLEGRYGQTLGKRMVGIKVIHVDLGPAGFGRGLLRNFFKFFIDVTMDYLLGVALIALTKKRQRVGDLVSKTLVVKCD